MLRDLSGIKQRALVIYDGPKFGSGHFRRSTFLKREIESRGVLVSSLALDPVSEGLSLEDALFLQISQSDFESVTHLVVDSYAYSHALESVVHGTRLRTLQLIDFTKQSAWGDIILDPFRAKSPSQGVYQGAEYAVFEPPPVAAISDLQAEPRQLLIATGSSVTRLHHSLAELELQWASIIVASPGKPLYESSKVRWTWSEDQDEFLRLLGADNYVVSNCGVTGLQRLTSNSRGLSLVTEDNQALAGRELSRIGANVHEDVSVALDADWLRNLPREQISTRPGGSLAEILDVFLST